MGKEIQSKSLLIVSGCSHSHSNLQQYLDHGIKTWPEIVADELDMELMNLARGSAPNDYIANSVMDAVLDNLDKNLTVMVLWTDSARWYGFEQDICWLTYNLRCMWRLNDFLNQRDVTFYQAATSCPTAGLDPQPPNEDIFKNRYFSKDYFTTQAPTDNMIWMGNEELMIPNDPHPNQKGHDWIAETFLLQYYGKDQKPFEENKNFTEFIYD